FCRATLRKCVLEAYWSTIISRRTIEKGWTCWTIASFPIQEDYGGYQLVAVHGMKMMISHKHMISAHVPASVALTPHVIRTPRPYCPTARSWLEEATTVS